MNLKYFKRKYIALIFASLVLIANVNFAYSQSICSMNMKKGCYCEEAKQKQFQPIISKTDCCKEVRKEISNTSNFQSIQQEFNSEIVCIVTLPIEVSPISELSFTSSIQNINHRPPKDIPVLNSTFRI